MYMCAAAAAAAGVCVRYIPTTGCMYVCMYVYKDRHRTTFKSQFLPPNMYALNFPFTNLNQFKE